MPPKKKKATIIHVSYRASMGKYKFVTCTYDLTPRKHSFRLFEHLAWGKFGPMNIS